MNIIRGIIFLILQLTSCSALILNVCTIVADGGRMPYGILRSGPALEFGIAELRTMMTQNVTVNYFLNLTTIGCTADKVGAIAAEMYYQHGASVFIGPACSRGVEVLGRMAKTWNLPIITPVGTDAVLGNKIDFPTLTRLAYTNEKLGRFYLDIFRLFGWSDIAVLYDTVFILYNLIGPGMHTEFVNAGLRSTILDFNSRDGVHFELLLRKASTVSRVFVVSCSGDTLRKLMLTAESLKMTQGDYVFIFFRLFKGEGIGDYSWYRNDNQDLVAKRAYRSLLIITLFRPETSSYETFASLVKNKSLADYNYDYGDFEVNPFVTAFHDAFTMYGTVINELLQENRNVLNGTDVTHRLWNRTFDVKSGRIRIDEQGNRETDLSLLDMDRVSGHYRVVGYFFGADGVFTLKNDTVIDWPNDKGPPVNQPRCGFTGNAPECQIFVFPVVGIVSIVFSCIILLTVIIAFFSYRHVKRESLLQSRWWQIRWDDIVQTENRCSSNSRLSFPNLSHKNDISFHDSIAQVFTTIAIYKGATVALKQLRIKCLNMTRGSLHELCEMRDLNCKNLTKFVGLCQHHDFTIIISEYCSKGSLQDLLHNDSLEFDTDFRASLVSDIVNGLAYLHGSKIHYHGKLSSSNCVIDSRFVLKLTDFGLQSIRNQECYESENNRASLWVAPELLGSSGGGLLKPSDYQMGDIYSFGIILYEIESRKEPYEDDLKFMTVEEILHKVEHSTNPSFRPRLDEIQSQESLKATIKRCWKQLCTERPSIHQIKKEFKESWDVSGGNFLDKLLRRMERYANNLEDIVEERTKAFLEEKKRSEKLLYQVLPRSVAEELKNGRSVDPEAFECVTIYFSDIVGFTSISATSTPFQVVDLLNDLYICFDAVVDNMDVYKVETIGDAYMVVSGLPVRNGVEHVVNIANMSLLILDSVRKFKIRHMPEEQLRARIGLHSGSVCAGVVGRKMPRYCLFGDTVNTASRMESNGEAMKIHISDATYELLQDRGGFNMQSRGQMPIKGKGIMQTYWLLGSSMNDGNDILSESTD